MRLSTLIIIVQTWFVLIQGQGPNIYHWGLGSIGFATPGDYECLETESRPEYVGFSLYANITTPGCYNFAEIFVDSSTSCNPNAPDCQLSFSAFGQENFSTTANYSQVDFQFLPTPENISPDVDPVELALLVFDSEDCLEGDHAPYQWSGCENTIEKECTQLPFSVASFYITGDDANVTGDCLSGVVRESEAESMRAGIVLLGSAMFVSALILV
ncbi:hypothetical protein CKM354_000758200 [Cercospora kikuchii]|uniref:Uncharacterized protein n=1 Tax=Cercospora kikuchii TaxID=84275 RepID=A0A9P3FIX4_9PEZI|nr:uncharacterized protein CKM354_000758200 [Cercospora kikuchii]GIZ44384.1 hypothetical protein CKM354_000758200 [Cercospora kikuchii]